MQAEITTGVKNRQTVSLTSRADKKPDIREIAESKPSGVLERERTRPASHSKKPALSRYTVSTMVPKSSTIVS